MEKKEKEYIAELWRINAFNLKTGSKEAVSEKRQVHIFVRLENTIIDPMTFKIVEWATHALKSMCDTRKIALTLVTDYSEQMSRYILENYLHPYGISPVNIIFTKERTYNMVYYDVLLDYKAGYSNNMWYFIYLILEQMKVLIPDDILEQTKTNIYKKISKEK